MKKLRNDKDARRELLKQKIELDPFLTDGELSELFAVSIQTVRLDRVALNIPEVRERAKRLAKEPKEQLHAAIRLNQDMGELLELNISNFAMSMLEITPQMVMDKSKLEQGYCLYKQAVALSLALLNAPSAYLGEVYLKFIGQVEAGDKIFARAELTGRVDDIYRVKVTALKNAQEIFRAKFIMLLS
ncbi:MAG: transcription factor FapR [Negativicutes bacterium]|jgi:hypothetical protein